MKALITLSLLSLILLTGCASTQVISANKGTGLNMDLPIGYNGANILQLMLKIGQFTSVVAVQPVATNKTYSPSFSVAETTDGNVVAPTIGTSTPSTANVSGADKFVVNGGNALSTITNAAGSITSQANQ